MGTCLNSANLLLQVGVGKKAEAVATVVAAVDLARVREPWELEHAEEAYAERTAAEYGYKERAVTERVVEVPAERHVVTKEVKTEAVHIPTEKHISAAEKMGVQVTTQVRFSLHCNLFSWLLF